MEVHLYPHSLYNKIIKQKQCSSANTAALSHHYRCLTSTLSKLCITVQLVYELLLASGSLKIFFSDFISKAKPVLRSSIVFVCLQRHTSLHLIILASRGTSWPSLFKLCSVSVFLRMMPSTVSLTSFMASAFTFCMGTNRRQLVRQMRMAWPLIGHLQVRLPRARHRFQHVTSPFLKLLDSRLQRGSRARQSWTSGA